MRRGLIALLVLLCGLALAGLSAAGTIRGSARGDVIRGTNKADKIYGGAGNDRIYGRGGNDRIYGGSGADYISCGSGKDIAYADSQDTVSKDCEIVRPDPTNPPPAPGGKDAPIPLGTTAQIDDGWQLAILSSDPNATQAILDSQAGDPDNLPLPPPPGYQFLVARVTVTRTAPEAATFSPYSLDLVSTTGAIYDSADYGCGLIPDALEADNLVGGQSATGDVCWELPAAQLRAVLADYTDPFTGKDTYFSLGL